ncbi:MAG TPA: lycopene cyclase domain-containing protein [Microbacterium sp.]|nr:lycopene cyclase domain-containing protein [Microbacterium sp.]
MPGLYLLALLVSIGGVLTIDARWRLAFWAQPGRTAAAVAIGTGFFLMWDAVGIATGVFVRGDSPALLGIDLAPHLPLEEPLFLAFLCHLSLVVYVAVLRRRPRAREERAS